MLFDWPMAMLSRLHVHVGGGRGQRLRHRGVGAAVHDAHRLAHRVGHLEAPARQLLAGLQVSSKPSAPSSVWPIRWARSGSSVTPRRLSFPAHGHLRPALCRAEGDHRARPQAGPELRRSSGRCSACPPRGCASWRATRSCASPPSRAAAVDDDWRGQLGDYLLNQQTGPESTATEGHLRRSEAARGWARSVLDSLEQFYERRGHPADPRGRGRAEPRRRRERKAKEPKEPKEPREREPKEPRPKRDLSPGAAAAVRRRRLIGVGAVAADRAVRRAGLAGQGPRCSRTTTSPTGRATHRGDQPRIVGQLVLRPQGNQGRNTAGIAVIAERGGQRQLIVQAQLPASKDREAYEVWLYNSPGRRPLARRPGDRPAGHLPGRRPAARATSSATSFIDVSREKVDQERGHSGNSVLRGRHRPDPGAAAEHAARARATSSAPRSSRRRRTRRPRPVGSSFPGFMIPAGSRRSLAARSTSRPSAPTSASIHGAWSAPDGVVVGDRAAVRRDRVARRGLGRAPLVELRARAPGGR